MIDIAHIRAVRNNNPGNIRIGDPWFGLQEPADMTPEQATEHELCVYKTPPYGFRAMAVILKKYAQVLPTIEGKFFCVEDIIARWAPPSENKTDAYVDAVCSRTGFQPRQPLTADFVTFFALLKAISTQEVGVWAFNDADLTAGLQMAGF